MEETQAALLVSQPAPLGEEGEEGSVGLDGDLERYEDASGSETDEDADMQQFGIHQCLPVEEGEPDWESEEPHTVEEYLKRVRFEAKQLPDVVTRSIHLQELSQTDQQQQQGERQGQRQPKGWASTPGIAGADAVADCPPERKPSIIWVRQFLQDFSQLRRRLQREHEVLLARGQACLDPEPTTEAAASASAQGGLHALRPDSPSALMPELQALQGLDHLRVLEQLSQHLQRVTASPSLSPEDAALLYALSARIERPLLGNTCALYRELLRHCARLRAALPDARDPLLPYLNVLITVAGGYFGQDEELAVLWEEDD